MDGQIPDWYSAMPDATPAAAPQAAATPMGSLQGPAAGGNAPDWYNAMPDALAKPAAAAASPTAGAAPRAPERSLGGHVLHAAEVGAAGLGKGFAAASPAGLAINGPSMGLQLGAALGTLPAYGINVAMGDPAAWESAKATARGVQNQVAQYVPNSSSLIDAVADKFAPGMMPKPENTAEDYISSGMQFAGGGKALGQNMALAGGAGLASEAAGQATAGSPFEPVARMAAGMMPFAGAAALSQGPKVSINNPLKPSETITTSPSRAKAAFKNVTDQATNPEQIAPTIARAKASNEYELVPDVKPSLGEIANDPGIAQVQNTMRLKYKQPFQDMEQQRQAGMVKALDKNTQLGEPTDISDFVGTRIGAADKAAADQMSAIGQYGKQPEKGATGLTVPDAQKYRQEQTGQLWNGFNKIQNGPADVVTLRNAAQDVVNSSSQYGIGGLHPDVKAVTDQILNPPEGAPDTVKTLQNFASQISAARNNPNLPRPAGVQLGQLQDAINTGLDNTVKGLAIQEPAYYDNIHNVWHGGRGQNPQGLTYFTPNKEMAQSYVDMTNERYGKNAGSLSQHKVLIQKPAPWEIVSKEAEKLGINPNDTMPASVFDREIYGNIADKLAKNLQAKGYDGAILDDVAYGKQLQDKAYIPFSSEQINPKAPIKLTPQEVKNYQQARAETARNYTLEGLEQRQAITPEGRLNTKKFDTWSGNPKNAVRLQRQELDQPLNVAAAAQRNADQLRASPMAKAAEPNVDPVKIVGQIFNSKSLDAAKQMHDAMNYVSDSPEAIAGLKSAVAKHINDYVAKTQSGNVSRANDLAQFFNKNLKALSEVYSPEELRNVQRVAAEIQRNQQYEKLASIKGQSATASNLKQLQMTEKPSLYNLTLKGMGHMASGAAMLGEHFGGLKGMAAGFSASKLAGFVGQLREAGIKNREMLELKMYTDPEFFQAMDQRFNGDNPSAYNRAIAALGKTYKVIGSEAAAAQGQSTTK